jgi:hypothetical protein
LEGMLERGEYSEDEEESRRMYRVFREKWVA